MRLRQGFTLIEMLVVVVIAAIVVGTALPSMGRAMASNDVQRSAGVIAATLQNAHSLAARRRVPVRLVIDTTNKIMSVRNYAGTDTSFVRMTFGANGEYPLQSMTASSLNLVIYPNGLAADTLSVTVRAESKSRRIRMTRAGQIRVIAP
ncbi:MAG TPA: prepilin-type N-terminal cleavage/methylation domain-containing protein [Longimicrobiales bacterium]|nr:prepilin-type N-terminal cleavage/methylation domain-containing protein [Longimicrobiales bacterium]